MSLSEDISTLSIDGRGIKVLPDLTRFENLKEFYCSDNQLTSLPALPQSLEKLYCFGNQLSSLPTLPQNLEILFCFKNKLTYLPTLPQNLEILFCFKNKLTYLPTLPEKILYIIYWNNPIWDILDNDNNSLIKIEEKIKIINNFRHLHYSLQFKKRFIKWLWKSREKQIMEKYHPNYLLENLDDNTDLDEFLNNW